MLTVGLPEVLLLVAALVTMGAGIWLLVAAFRVSIGWGLLIFFLGWTWIPLIVFAVKYWEQAKKPLILYGVGVVLSLGAILYSGVVLATAFDSLPDGPERPVGRPTTGDEILPPPRPTAEPTHPSWEAIVHELEGDAAESWETLVPSPPPIDERSGPGVLDWNEAASHIGRKAVIALGNGKSITATLEAVEPSRIRVRYVIGGGEASYWIEREQVEFIRLAN